MQDVCQNLPLLGAILKTVKYFKIQYIGQYA